MLRKRSFITGNSRKEVQTTGQTMETTESKTQANIEIQEPRRSINTGNDSESSEMQCEHKQDETGLV